MQITVTFKQIDPSDALKSYVQKKVDRFDKMLESPAEANVVLSVEKIRHIAEITLVCDRLKIHAKEESENMYSSIDTLMDKIAAQIKKSKDKMRHHMSGNKASIKDNDILLPTPDEISDEISGTDSQEVILEAIDVKPMDIDDAVMELNSGKENFFVFSNARTERVNVIYRRNDGKLGLIQPRR
ncbi:MAG: ribosome-associated translation inhibitor RaiA [Desulfobacterium sp.]|jgi:putative sigma-54 modulation protein|nr:ribosome-associated translation inhibitor RaiA [Desulfobacterium sp.]